MDEKQKQMEAEAMLYNLISWVRHSSDAEERLFPGKDFSEEEMVHILEYAVYAVTYGMDNLDI